MSKKVQQEIPPVLCVKLQMGKLVMYYIFGTSLRPDVCEFLTDKCNENHVKGVEEGLQGMCRGLGLPLSDKFELVTFSTIMEQLEDEEKQRDADSFLLFIDNRYDFAEKTVIVEASAEQEVAKEVEEFITNNTPSLFGLFNGVNLLEMEMA